MKVHLFCLLAIICLLKQTYCQEDDDGFSFGGGDIDEDPVIQLSPGDVEPIEVTVGGQIYSLCSVKGIEQYSFKWIQRLPQGPIKELSNNARLFMQNVQFTDLQYPILCQVRRLSDGRIYEKILNHRSASAGGVTSYTLTIKSLPNEDIQRGVIMRRCLFEEDENFNRQFDFRWLDQNNRVYTSGDTLYLLIEDPIDLGNYVCEATNRQTGVIYQARYRISKSVKQQASQHVVNIRPVTGDILIGRPYEMVCEVDPSPAEPVTFTWYHRDRTVGRSARLSIASLTHRDIGGYVCRAEWTPRFSRTGSIAANATVELSLALTREPIIEMSIPPGSVMVSLPNETRELHCEYNIPNPTDVRWYFENQVLENHPFLNRTGNIFRMDRMRVSIISIRGVEPEHAGTYECRIGRDVKQSHLIVRTEQGIEVNPHTETVDEGAPVEFHCRIHGLDGDVNRRVEWYFRQFNSPIKVPLEMNRPEHFVRQDDPFTQHTSFISKARARLSDQGEYICRLPEGNREALSRLFVRAVRSYHVTITPPILRVAPNQLISLVCVVNDETGAPAMNMQPRYRITDASIVYDTKRTGDNQLLLRIPNGLGVHQNGTFVFCETEQGGHSARSVIIIEDRCDAGSRRCRSGQCLPIGRFCDGVRDCFDGTDEDPKFCTGCDPIARKCEYYQGKEPIKNTFMIHWSCDGESDCGNGFDEINCENRITERCHDTMFTCQGDRRRIPMAFVCDDDRDCMNGEDEIGCSSPIVSELRNNRYVVTPGDQVVLQCEVTGHPVPYVIWRFNWGCLPADSVRFRVTNVAQNCNSPMPTVRSTLVITNVRPGDDGIYNCEALSGQNRALSNDYFVILKQN